MGDIWQCIERQPDNRYVLIGVHQSWYNVTTLYEVDGNLESISRGLPRHPDVDLLLEWRRIVSAVEFLVSDCTTKPECPTGCSGCPWEGTVTTESRRFHLERDADVTGVSGTGHVADGVQWPDGTAAVRWRGERPSTVHWDRIDDAIAIHGHGGSTRIIWDD
jgi:hypothetical protein